MKIRSLQILLILFVVSSYSLAQQEPETKHYIGLDVINSLPSYIIPEKYFLKRTIIVEPSWMIDLKNPKHGLVFGAGFAKGSTNRNNPLDSSQHFQGAYVRAAHEIRRDKNPRKRIRAGYGPVLAMANLRGAYRFEGPVFGDYLGSYSDPNSFAIGIDAYAAWDFKLKKNFMLRFLVRNTMGHRTKSPAYAQYYPGFGYAYPGANNKFLYAGSFSLQLYYRVR